MLGGARSPVAALALLALCELGSCFLAPLLPASPLSLPAQLSRAARQPLPRAGSLRLPAMMAGTVSAEERTSETRRPLHKYWWPVGLQREFSDGKPHAVTLLGQKLVVWQSAEGFHCADDRCVHRFAPLSEGRVLSSGCLSCSYHGWQFDKDGACVAVPQADAGAQQSVRQNPKSRLRTYPVHVAAGMVFVYPDASGGAWAESAREPPPVSPLLVEHERVCPADINVFMRDLPYGYELLCENLLDLAHLPYSHHGVGNLKRDKGGPMVMKILTPTPDANSGRAPEFEARVESGDPIPSVDTRIRFFTPGHIRYERQMPAGPKGTIPFNVELFATPTEHGRSRVFLLNKGAPAGSPSSIKVQDKPVALEEGGGVKGVLLCLWALLFTTPLRDRLMPVWSKEAKRSLSHMFSHIIFDGDGIFLRLQGERMTTGSGLTFSDYFTPTSSDVTVLRFRKWLGAVPSGELPFASRFSGPIPYPELTREQMLDRYVSHTAQCSSCALMVQIFRLQQRALAVMGAVAFLGASASLGALWGPVGWGLCGVLAAVSAGCVWARAGVEDLVHKKYVFEDYVHSEKP